MPKGARSSSPKPPALSSGPGDRQRYTFPAERRLLRKAQFEAVQGGGRRSGNGFFAVTAQANEVHAARLGLAVSIRTAGNAVERNRLRRMIRESFRLHQHELPPLDLVVSARTRARGADGALLRAELEALWRGLKKT